MVKDNFSCVIWYCYAKLLGLTSEKWSSSDTESIYKQKKDKSTETLRSGLNQLEYKIFTIILHVCLLNAGLQSIHVIKQCCIMLWMDGGCKIGMMDTAGEWGINKNRIYQLVLIWSVREQTTIFVTRI